MGNIVTRLTLDSSAFDAGLNAAKRTSNNFAHQIKELGAQVAAVFTIQKAIEFSHELIEMGAHIKNLSMRLNITTDEFQKMTASGRIFGVETHELELVFSKMLTHANEAVRGAGKIQEHFEWLGVSMDQLKGFTMNNDSIGLWNAIIKGASEEVKKAGGHFKVLNAIVALGSKAGREVFQVYMQGSERLAESIKNLNLIPKDQIAKLHEANAQLIIMWANIKAIGAVGLAGKGGAIDYFHDTFDPLAGGKGRSIGGPIADVVVGGTVNFALLSPLSAWAAETLEYFKDFSPAIDSAAQSARSFNNQSQRLKESAVAFFVGPKSWNLPGAQITGEDTVADKIKKAEQRITDLQKLLADPKVDKESRVTLNEELEDTRKILHLFRGEEEAMGVAAERLAESKYAQELSLLDVRGKILRMEKEERKLEEEIAGFAKNHNEASVPSQEAQKKLIDLQMKSRDLRLQESKEQNTFRDKSREQKTELSVVGASDQEELNALKQEQVRLEQERDKQNAFIGPKMDNELDAARDLTLQIEKSVIAVANKSNAIKKTSEAERKRFTERMTEYDLEAAKDKATSPAEEKQVLQNEIDRLKAGAGDAELLKAKDENLYLEAKHNRILQIRKLEQDIARIKEDSNHKESAWAREMVRHQEGVKSSVYGGRRGAIIATGGGGPSFAGGGEFLTKGPMTMLVGDNPGGVERVTVEPISGKGVTRPLSAGEVTPTGYARPRSLLGQDVREERPWKDSRATRLPWSERFGMAFAGGTGPPTPHEAQLMRTFAAVESSSGKDKKYPWGDNGKAYGLYQFHLERWKELGGTAENFGKAGPKVQNELMLAEIRKVLSKYKGTDPVLALASYHKIGHVVPNTEQKFGFDKGKRKRVPQTDFEKAYIKKIRKTLPGMAFGGGTGVYAGEQTLSPNAPAAAKQRRSRLGGGDEPAWVGDLTGDRKGMDKWLAGRKNKSMMGVPAPPLLPGQEIDPWEALENRATPASPIEPTETPLTNSAWGTGAGWVDDVVQPKRTRSSIAQETKEFERYTSMSGEVRAKLPSNERHRLDVNAAHETHRRSIMGEPMPGVSNGIAGMGNDPVASSLVSSKPTPTVPDAIAASSNFGGAGRGAGQGSNIAINYARLTTDNTAKMLQFLMSGVLTVKSNDPMKTWEVVK